MKKILIALIALVAVSTTQAQTKDFMTYYSVGGGYTPSKPVGTWLTLEAGCWGVEKPVMYGISLDVAGPDYSKPSLWVGIKPYYQIYQAKNYYLFTYAAPKWNLHEDVSLEMGLINYTQVTKHFYTSVYFGYAKTTMDAWHSPVFGLGMNLVY